MSISKQCAAIFCLISTQTVKCGLKRPYSKLLDRKKLAFFFNDTYHVELPPKHRFPMKKYQLVRESVQKDLIDNTDVFFCVSPMATKEELSLTHCENYISRYLSGEMTPVEIRRTGFPWSKEHVVRSTSSVGGTVAAMRAVMSDEFADFGGHIAGGTHHAFYDYGEGFCIFSDIAVAANIALKEYKNIISKIVIIDLDVHQGNGNAVLFENSQEVFTFSMHCKDNIFSKKRKSNIDVELEVGTTDTEYLDTLKTWLPLLIDVIQPQLVFYQAGVDILGSDRLGKLALTREGVSKRNRLVFEYLRRKNIKCVVTMGGGYPKDLDISSASFKEIVETHADVYRDCVKTYFEN